MSVLNIMKQRPWIKSLSLLLAFLFVPLLLGLSSGLPAIAATPKHYTELTFPPLPDVQIPAYERFTLGNGLTVYLMEDHELPLVGGTALIRTGERFDPPAQVGLGDIATEVMRSGGTRQYPADQLNQRLEQRAASVELGIDDAVASASFSALSNDLETVFSLFADVLQDPAFPQDKLDLAKRQHKGAIDRRNDKPSDISRRELKKLIYGSDNPYARTEEYQTLNRIGLNDLQSFHRRYFHPNCMILGIVGDFNPAQMRQLLDAHLGSWLANPNAQAEIPPAAAQIKKGGVYIVDRPQLTQSSVLIGQLGGKSNDPDSFALSVLNEALNSFGGRLFNEVRSRQGLAYSVYAVWSPRYDYPGLFLAGGETRSEATVPFIQSVRTELAKVQQAPLTPQELTFAKESILNSFVFNFVDPAQTLSRLMRYDYFDYPKDFIFRYQKAVKEMTAQKVLDAAQRVLKPQEMVVLVVGNRKTIDPNLETLKQTVTAIDIEIPKG
ncbi:MAG: pitrilysin family protein [Thermosynechococcaceae cyanobacterium]